MTSSEISIAMLIFLRWSRATEEMAASLHQIDLIALPDAKTYWEAAYWGDFLDSVYMEDWATEDTLREPDEQERPHPP